MTGRRRAGILAVLVGFVFAELAAGLLAALWSGRPLIILAALALAGGS